LTVATLNVDQWTGTCVGRLSDLTPPELTTMDQLWTVADTLWEAHAHRDPIEVADEWQRSSGLPLRIWPSGSV
jgi:hypothetical protein